MNLPESVGSLTTVTVRDIRPYTGAGWLVALLLFALGAGVAVYEGITYIAAPAPMARAAASVAR